MELSEVFKGSASKAAEILMRNGLSLTGTKTAASDIQKAEVVFFGLKGKLEGMLDNLSSGLAIPFEELDGDSEKYWILKKYIAERKKDIIHS